MKSILLQDLKWISLSTTMGKCPFSIFKAPWSIVMFKCVQVLVLSLWFLTIQILVQCRKLKNFYCDALNRTSCLTAIIGMDCYIIIKVCLMHLLWLLNHNINWTWTLLVSNTPSFEEKRMLNVNEKLKRQRTIISPTLVSKMIWLLSICLFCLRTYLTSVYRSSNEPQNRWFFLLYI